MRPQIIRQQMGPLERGRGKADSEDAPIDVLDVTYLGGARGGSRYNDVDTCTVHK